MRLPLPSDLPATLQPLVARNQQFISDAVAAHPELDLQAWSPLHRQQFDQVAAASDFVLGLVRREPAMLYGLLASGELTTLDNQIDPATGTLKLKATFANADDSLFPNQFVNVRLNIAEKAGAVTIPQDAVQYGSEGTYIYVVENNKAQLKVLELGVVDNGQVEVRKGLNAGDQIVLEGLDRLRPGRDVEVVQSSKQG